MVGATDASDRLHDVGLSTMKTWKIAAAALAVGGVAAAGLIGLGVGDGAGRGGDAEADPTQERTAASVASSDPVRRLAVGPSGPEGAGGAQRVLPPPARGADDGAGVVLEQPAGEVVAGPSGAGHAPSPPGIHDIKVIEPVEGPSRSGLLPPSGAQVPLHR
jgi:hypothetical protein